MDNKKRLIGEEVPQITKGDIDVWNRGKDDAVRNKLLRATQKLSPKKAMELIKMYAAVGEVHYLSTRFDIDTDEVRRVLSVFGVNSIEDAKAAVSDGIIAEYDEAVTQNREEQTIERAVEHTAATKRLDQYEQDQETTEKTIEEQDIDLAQRRDTAQRLNKEDQLRQLIAEGIDPKTNMSTFRIPFNQVSQFKKMIPYGVSQLQRRFGGSGKDIVDEIQRLAPDFNTDMLRP